MLSTGISLKSKEENKELAENYVCVVDKLCLFVSYMAFKYK
jgi:hypothetical protein